MSTKAEGIIEALRALAMRGRNRLQRVPAIGASMVQASELWDTARFMSDADGRQRSAHELAACKSAEDFLLFSQKHIASHQRNPEILAFLAHALTIAPRRVCEIGTAAGGTNFLLGRALPDVELMIGVDLFVRHKTRLRAFAPPRQRVAFIDGSTRLSRTRSKLAALLGGEQLDLLFIDGDHEYDGVRQDFLDYRALVRDRGLIAFHDIVPDYMTRFGRETGNWAGGVPRFWHELRTRYESREFIEDPGQDGFGIGVITYAPDVPLADL